MFKAILNFIVSFILLPFAVGIFAILTGLDRSAKALEALRNNFGCAIGAHQPSERGPHRQMCICCHKHFDVDLMATNLEQGRIGFVEQTIPLGTVGNVDELPWVFDLAEGNGNQLAALYRVYDILWIMWRDGMTSFRNDQ